MNAASKFLGSRRCTYYYARVRASLYAREWRNLRELGNLPAHVAVDGPDAELDRHGKGLA